MADTENLVESILANRKAAKARITEIDQQLVALSKERKNLRVLVGGGGRAVAAPAVKKPRKARAKKADKPTAVPEQAAG